MAAFFKVSLPLVAPFAMRVCCSADGSRWRAIADFGLPVRLFFGVVVVQELCHRDLHQLGYALSRGRVRSCMANICSSSAPVRFASLRLALLGSVSMLFSCSSSVFSALYWQGSMISSHWIPWPVRAVCHASGHR